MHTIEQLTAIFEGCFFDAFQTRLIRGQDEPIYLPLNQQTSYHQIVFAHGYYASALHEIAHWLVAGDARRLLEDYGYWYCPDGRTAVQQAEFEKVEVLPQAIEWCLSVAAGFKFNVSCDNLNGEQTCRHQFQRAVHDKVTELLQTGFNTRTQTLLKALSDYYKTPWPLSLSHFEWQSSYEV